MESIYEHEEPAYYWCCDLSIDEIRDYDEAEMCRGCQERLIDWLDDLEMEEHLLESGLHIVHD